jgi:RNA polymerase sigma-70 factor (ECF subfamily)
MGAAPNHAVTGEDRVQGTPGPPGGSLEDVKDAALLRAFLDGDETAFAALVVRHGRMVLGVVRRYARDPEEARDLAQRTFLRALEAARRTALRGEVRVRPWLAQIAINLAKNGMRDSARRARASLEHAQESGPRAQRRPFGPAAAGGIHPRPRARRSPCRATCPRSSA